MALNCLDDIKAAIQQLSAPERHRLQSWLAASFSYETDSSDSHPAGSLSDHVAEPAVLYGAPVPSQRISVDEYLEFEANSEQRHEYIDGAVYAMSGVSEKHELIAGNLFAALHGHVRGGPCRPYKSDFKVRSRLDQRDFFYYPDVMVSCVREGVDSHYLRYPKLIVEVLSPATQSIDRREKFLSYTQIATVEEYVLASQDAAEITIYRRAEQWAPRVRTESDGTVAFRSIGLSLALRQIYEGVPLPAGPSMGCRTHET